MSRFKKNFAVLEVGKWADIKSSIDSISEEDLQNNEAATDELDRLKLTIEAIAESTKSIQPFAELINPDIQNHVKSLENHLRNLKASPANQRLNHLNSLNNIATTILERLWPFAPQSEAAKAAGQAFDRYKKLIEAEAASITDLHSEADTAISAIRSISTELTAYRTQLVDGTDESKSIKDQVEEKITMIDNMLANTEAFYQRLTQGDGGSASIQNEILNAQKNATENSSKIADKLSDAERKLNELDRIYSDVVGVSTGDEDQQTGLKDQLEHRQAQLNEMVNDFERKFEGLVDQVEDLLPGATSAGLASAYNVLRTTAEQKAAHYSTAFFALVGLLTITASIAITESFAFYPLSWQGINISDPAEYLTKLLFKLPIVIPVLWAALTVSKRRSEMHRLAEEYAHKEALAKSYEGFKKQIIELKKDDNELLAELLAAMLKAVSLNAATTLDGKHGEKMPTQTVIEDTVKTLANRIS